MLTFSKLELLDLFFRFAAVGCLLFINLVWLEKTKQTRVWITRTLLLCLAGYLILTAPIDDSAYGHIRGVVLLLTECLPYVLWLYVFTLIKPQSNLFVIPWFLKAAAVAMLLWFVYFFGMLQGRGSFHQINHVIGLLLYAHIAFMAVFDLKDDLLPKRRKIRVAMAIFFGAYSSCLALLEIFDYSLRGDPWFSVANSASIFVLVLLFPLLMALSNRAVSAKSAQNIPDTAENKVSIPVIYKADFDKLNSLMAEKFYTQSNLSIGVLATALRMPEHRLRCLINQVLGYQNFSVFLNSYRIPEAQNVLSDQAQIKCPILSIALELGYGSIGPFNRAFKHTTGLTPSEYRKKIQNRP